MANSGFADRTTLNSLLPNLDIGDVADPALRAAAFQYLYDLSDANWTYLASLVANGTLSPYPAFLSRNALINGNFDVWQRGTSFDNPGNGTYMPDRFKIGNNSVDNNLKVLRSTTVPNGKSKYSCRLEVFTATAGANAQTVFDQYIEDYAYFSGQKVTLSGYIKCDTGASVIPSVYDGVTTTVGASINATTWTLFSLTATIGASPTALRASLQFNRGGLAVGVGVNIAQLQINAGDVALSFQPRSFAEELQLCQRYFEKSYDLSVVPGAVNVNGAYGYRTREAIGASIADFLHLGNVNFKVTKRVTPTVVIYSSEGIANAVRNVTAVNERTGVTADLVNPQAIGRLSVSNASANAIALDNLLRFHWTVDAEI